MGTWGPGNFDDDTAQEHLAETLQPLLAQVRATAGDREAMQPDEYESVAMLCNLEMLSCLAEDLSTPIPLALPSTAEVEEWESAYLQVWDACIDQLLPKGEFKKTRRDVIIKTFARFRSICAGKCRERQESDCW